MQYKYECFAVFPREVKKGVGMTRSDGGAEKSVLTEASADKHLTLFIL